MTSGRRSNSGWRRCGCGSRLSRRAGSGGCALGLAIVCAGMRSLRRWSDGRLNAADVIWKMRVFFATDIHGSETCWRKFLNSAPHYHADVVILGGDMTGKALVPVVDDGGGA